jgi:hypothetical protein
MEKTTILQTAISGSSEKERLEIIEKKVDIQKKRVELKKEKLNADEIVMRRKISMEEQKVLIDKISELRAVLSDWTIDEERTIMASEPFLKTTIEGAQREMVLNKIIELIKRL